MSFDGVIYEKNVGIKSLCNNMDKLIPLVNHRISKIETNIEKFKIDLSWIKKFISIQTALLTALVLGLLWTLIQL